MDKKHLVLAGFIAVVMLGVSFFAFSALTDANHTLGTVINPSNALNQQRLINDFNSITSDLQNVRAPLASISAATTASIDFPNMTSGSSTLATSTTVTGLVASLGDFLLVSPTVYTGSSTYTAQVQTASTTSATITIVELNGSGAAALDATNTTYNIVDLPAASFKAAVALNTSTST